MGAVRVTTATSANVLCREYECVIRLDGGMVFNGYVVEAPRAPLANDSIQCVIGRDVLKFGVFIYTGFDDSFTFSL